MLYYCFRICIHCELIFLLRCLCICLVSIACKTGSYGVNCNGTCGHCRNSYECFHIDGLCMNGCEVGFSGSMCKSGMYLDIGWMNRNINTR